MKIKAGIIGAAGYTGGETARLLINHPGVELLFAQSRSNAGKALADIHTGLFGETDLLFCEEPGPDADVLFLCLGHGEAKKFLGSSTIGRNTRIIDLSHDFRLEATRQNGDRTFVYGLPELNRNAIKQAQNIANPGCFATAIQLSLLPLVQAGLPAGGVYTTGITGSTGAGQSLSPTSHFSWRSNNIQAYKSLDHQHVGEISESLAQLSGRQIPLHFIPWRGDFARGIYVSSVVDCEWTSDQVNDLYRAFYSDAPFTHLSPRMIDLKQVINTNKCLIHIEQQNGKLAIHAAIDNLLKGAAGQAVQNMNLMFGLDEGSGLQLKATQF